MRVYIFFLNRAVVYYFPNEKTHVFMCYLGLTLTSEFNGVALVVAFFGFSKGVRAVFMPLVIPNYVPLGKLPSAQGLQNIMHGLFLMILGPVIGMLCIFS